MIQRSLILGSALATVACLMGAALAAAMTWRSMGRPDKEGLVSQLQTRTEERKQRIDQSAIGSGVWAVRRSAEGAVGESETLSGFASGIRKQFNPSRGPAK